MILWCVTCLMIAGDCQDEVCSEASALSRWDDVDCETASSGLSDWGESIPELDSCDDNALEDQGLGQSADAAPVKLGMMGKMLQLGRLGPAQKPKKLPVKGDEVMYLAMNAA